MYPICVGTDGLQGLQDNRPALELKNLKAAQHQDKPPRGKRGTCMLMCQEECEVEEIWAGVLTGAFLVKWQLTQTRPGHQHSHKAHSAIVLTV